MEVSVRSSGRALRLAFCIVVVVCSLPAIPAETPPGDGRPNVILISLDTLRADHLSLYGYGRETSPNLDQIARDSIVFEKAIAQSSSTTPSHRSLFLSRHSSASRTNMPMLAEILKDAGYDTAAFTGGGGVDVHWGFGAGFDTYFAAREKWRGGGTRTFVEIIPEFEAWLAVPRARPFFLFLHSYDIHHPYDAPAPYGRRFCGDYDGRIYERQAAVILEKIRRVNKFWRFRGEVTVPEADRRQIRALYDGGILYADSYLGRIAALLKQAGLWDRTMLVVLSDHGEELWDHGSVLHSHTVYQELVHVPLVIRLPGGRLGGRRVEDPVQLMDVAPTILNELGLPPAATHQGNSLFPLVSGQNTATKKVILSEIKFLRGYLKWPVKMVENRETGVVEWFNLKSDPLEQDGSAAGNADEMTRLMVELKNEVSPLGAEAVRDVNSIPENETLRDQLRALGYIE